MGNVFVIGGNHHNTLGVIRSLGEKGLNPKVIIQTDDKNPYVSYSRYISECWIAGTDREVLDILRSQGQKFGDRAVLIACSDGLSSLIDLNRSELLQWYYLPEAGEDGRITTLMDKETMSLLAKQVGLLVPDSIATDTEADNVIEIPMPWIIKPLISKNGRKTDIERIYSTQEWTEYCKHHKIQVQVQQLIDKDFEYQLIGLSLNGGEEVIIPGLSYIIRPASNTNTGFLHYRPLDESYDEVLRKGRSFLKATGYSGLFSLEFLRGKDGKDYFMEINFRNDGNAICVTASGTNLPYIWYLYHTKGDYQHEIATSRVNPVYVMPEFEDFRFVSHFKMGLIKWLRDVHKTDRFMDYDKNDKAPFRRMLRVFLGRGFRKIEGKVI
jgi:predicted ATP-grasp superfamily ATP-dependent carboligase